MTATSTHDWLALAGKVFAVTGAASGIGNAVALELASAGALVALLDRNGDAVAARAEQLSKQGARTLGIQCNVADEAQVRAAADRVRAELGPCAGLVNNAGFVRAGPLESVSLADWNSVLAVNLSGYLLCAREFARSMKQRGQGSIVHIASISGLHPQTRSGAYSASKAGVLLLSRQMAAEWGPSGIRSNAICPGMIKTALSAKFYEEPGLEQKRAAVTASRRVGEPIDIANSALFLLSERSDYVNGAELLVDGGLSCMLMDTVPRPGFNDTASH
jgi:glucose 1-dehydrogenase